MVSQHRLQVKLNSVAPGSLGSYPNYLYVYFLHLVSPLLSCLIVTLLYFVRNRSLRSAFVRRINHEFWLFNYVIILRPWFVGSIMCYNYANIRGQQNHRINCSLTLKLAFTSDCLILFTNESQTNHTFVGRLQIFESATDTSKIFCVSEFVMHSLCISWCHRR
jgi:hypothetical protein